MNQIVTENTDAETTNMLLPLDLSFTEGASVTVDSNVKRFMGKRNYHKLFGNRKPGNTFSTCSL